MNAREALIDFVVQYGGRCRDCADEDGFCPQTGIGCGQRRKAVEFVLGAIEYGAKHSFVSGYSILRDDETHAPTERRALERAAELAIEQANADLVLKLLAREERDGQGAMIHAAEEAEARSIAAAIRALIKEGGE